jgi:translocation and assembly module TamB
MLRLIRLLLIALLVLLVLTVGVASYLTLSETGSRWLIARVLPVLPGTVEVADVHGRLAGGLRLVDVDYRLEGTTVHSDLLVVRWRPAGLLEGTLRIQQLLLQNLNISVGEAQTDSAPTGIPESIPLPLTVALDELRIEGLQVDTGGEPTRIDSLVLSARAGPFQGLTVRHFELHTGDSSVELEGQAALRTPYPFSAQANWRTTLPEAVEAAGQASLDGDINTLRLTHTLSSPFQVATSGSVALDQPEPVLALRGTWQAIQWPLTGPADYSSAQGEYSLDGTLSDYRVTLSGPLAGSAIPPGQVRASGTGNGQGMHIDKLDLDTLGGQASATGEIAWAPHFNLRLAIDGTGLDPGRYWPTGDANLALSTQLEVDVGERSTLVALRKLDIKGTLQGHALSAGGALLFNDGVPSSPGLTVNAGANRASLSGTLDASGIKYNIAAPDPERLLPGLTGSLKAHGLLTGPMDRLAGNLTLDAQELAYQGRQAGGVQASVRLDATHRAQLEIDAQDVLLGPTPVERLALRGDGTLERHSATLQLVSPHGSVRLDVQGGYRDAFWNGRIDTATFQLEDAGDWRLREPVALRIGSGRAEPFAACWSADGRELCLQGEWQGDNAQLQLNGQSAEGHARGDIALRGLQQERPRLAGRIDASLPDIRFLDPLLPDAHIKAGAAAAQAQLKGYLDSPEVIGNVTLSGAALGIEPLGLDITDINLEAHGGGQRVTLTGSAHSGTGEIALNGKLELDPQRDWPFDMVVTGKNFAVMQKPDTEILADPDLKLDGTARQAAVTGKLHIPRARITLKKLPPDVVRVSPDQVIVGAAAPHESARAPGYPVSLNVVATLGDDVHFEGLGLTTDLAGSLNVRSLETATLIGNGVLELRNGRYEGYGQKLSIDTGRLLFSGPLDNPALEVRATRSVDGVVAGIELYGTAKVPQTRLFSTPAMSDAEILSYIVTGKPLGASSGSADGQALAAAAASLGANSPVAQEISQKLGVELGVQSGTTDTDTALVVSKQLSSRLSVDYVYGLFNESAAIQFIYELTDNLSLTGRSGAVQSIDLNYSIETP